MKKKVLNTKSFKHISTLHINKQEPINFWRAWKVPGVALYASVFFSTKMTVYCLLLWLPTVLSSSPFNYPKSPRIATL